MIEIRTWQSPYTGVVWKTCARCGLFVLPVKSGTRTICGPCEDCGGECDFCLACTGIKTQ
jgi:hypothetical protein